MRVLCFVPAFGETGSNLPGRAVVQQKSHRAGPDNPKGPDSMGAVTAVMSNTDSGICFFAYIGLGNEELII